MLAHESDTCTIGQRSNSGSHKLADKNRGRCRWRQELGPLTKMSSGIVVLFARPFAVLSLGRRAAVDISLASRKGLVEIGRIGGFSEKGEWAGEGVVARLRKGLLEERFEEKFSERPGGRARNGQ